VLLSGAPKSASDFTGANRTRFDRGRPESTPATRRLQVLDEAPSGARVADAGFRLEDSESLARPLLPLTIKSGAVTATDDFWLRQPFRYYRCVNLSGATIDHSGRPFTLVVIVPRASIVTV
jgi:hypothetical protein